MLNWSIEDNHVVYECGCKFKIHKVREEKLLPRIRIDYDDLPLCKEVWRILAEGKTKGVFQLESQFGKQWAQDVKPESLEHMSALGSILRPGSLQSIDADGISTTKHYSLRKNLLEPVEKIHPALDFILKDTYGLMIYQEQAIMIASKLAGFTPSQAELLRKSIGKKDTLRM